MKAQSKPSDIHNDESGELLKKRAEAANRKRKERQEELKRKENIRQREEFRKAKAEQEAKEAAEEAERVRKEQEEKMWREAAKEKEKKEPNKSQFGKKIKTEVDGESFDSLAKAMAWIDPVLWGKENAYRTSCWIKINRALKRDGECEFQGHKYRMI